MAIQDQTDAEIARTVQACLREMERRYKDKPGHKSLRKAHEQLNTAAILIFGSQVSEFGIVRPADDPTDGDPHSGGQKHPPGG